MALEEVTIGCGGEVVRGVPAPVPAAVGVRLPEPSGRVVAPWPGPEGPHGPEGPEGPPGVPGTGPSWWFGHGPPGTIIGSKPGDRYLDEDTGDIYQLGD